MSALDALLFGYRKILVGGIELAQRSVLELVGATVEDDPDNGRTRITVGLGFLDELELTVGTATDVPDGYEVPANSITSIDAEIRIDHGASRAWWRYVVVYSRRGTSAPLLIGGSLTVPKDQGGTGASLALPAGWVGVLALSGNIVQARVTVPGATGGSPADVKADIGPSATKAVR